jgi:hypothetical protein
VAAVTARGRQPPGLVVVDAEQAQLVQLLRSRLITLAVLVIASTVPAL